MTQFISLGGLEELKKVYLETECSESLAPKYHCVIVGILSELLTHNQEVLST